MKRPVDLCIFLHISTASATESFFAAGAARFAARPDRQKDDNNLGLGFLLNSLAIAILQLTERLNTVITEFSPGAALLGGAMIGLASVLLMAVKGRIAGISGIAVRLFPPYQDREWFGRAVFVAGLILAPLVFVLVTGTRAVVTIEATPVVLVAAGLLVGFGSVWGSGCTSGHGVCGLSRLSARSAVAVATFMTTAALTVFTVRHLL